MGGLFFWELGFFLFPPWFRGVFSGCKGSIFGAKKTFPTFFFFLTSERGPGAPPFGGSLRGGKFLNGLFQPPPGRG